MPTLTLNIPNTTFVSSAQPDNNLSTYPLMYAGTDPSFQYCISLMQIALPSIPVTKVDSALLQLAVIVKSGAAPSPVVVNRVTTPFDKATVTYNTLPQFTATTSQINVTTSDLYTTIQIDVTSLVNEWLAGTFPNEGIALTNIDGTTEVQFATNAIVYEPYFPQLTLTYSSTPADNTAICYSYAQLANIINQLIAMYSTNVITVYTTGLAASTITGTPYQLYSSSEGTYGGIFVLLDAGQQEAIPLNSITAIYTGAGTVYNPEIKYLPPQTFTPGCDTNIITAIHDYLSVSTNVQMYMGSNISASGMIYKNEYGILVLSDELGNTPVFIPVTHITAVLSANAITSEQKGEYPRIAVVSQNQL